ncbi:MAG: hypothetical protein WCP55_00495 [Lentisphaerota bacterium]
MKKTKIVLLGGGSGYFEYAVAEIATEPELESIEFMFYDIDEKRMDVMCRIGKRIVEKAKKNYSVKMTRDLAEALDGADYAISSIGVHGPNAAWHLMDVNACVPFGIIHTTGDTVGPAGLSQGLRLIPRILEIAKAMEKYCPDAIILNHSNPMAPICRAINKYTSIKVIGYCHNIYGDIFSFAKILEVSPKDLDVTVGGVNHCGWLLGIRHKGTDVYPELKKRLASATIPPEKMFAYEVFQLTGLYPIGGSRHLLEFFPHGRTLDKTTDMPYAQKWRGGMIKEGMVQAELNKGHQELDLKAAGKKDVWMAQEQTPEAMGKQIKSLLKGPSSIHYVNIPNRGSIPNLPDWAVVEVKSLVGQHNAVPVYTGELPPQAARWALAQTYAHELTVEAAVEKSRSKAIMALASDPLIRDFKEAGTVFDALVKAQGERLKDFRVKNIKQRNFNI